MRLFSYNKMHRNIFIGRYLASSDEDTVTIYNPKYREIINKPPQSQWSCVFCSTQSGYIFFPLILSLEMNVIPAVYISKLNHIFNNKTLKNDIDMHDLQTLSINLLSPMHLATTKRPFSQCGEVHAGKGLSCTRAGTFSLHNICTSFSPIASA